MLASVLVFAQLFNAFNARSSSASAFRHLFSNRWLWLSVAIAALLQVAVVHLALLNTAFGTVPLAPSQWGACVAMASVVLWYEELRKLWSRRRRPVPASISGEASGNGNRGAQQ